MEILLPIATFLALLGAYYVSNGNWVGFAIWIATDIVFMLNNYFIGQWEQAVLFALYLFIAANGVYNMKFKSKVFD